MRSFSKRISSKLATVPSLLYALFYLACIPIFGFFYSKMPGEFYHATVRYEAYLNHNSDQIMSDLASAIQKQHEAEIGSPVKRTGNDDAYVEYDLSTLKLSHADVQGEYIYFSAKIQGVVKPKAASSLIQFTDHAHLRIPACCLHFGQHNYLLPEDDNGPYQSIWLMEALCTQEIHSNSYATPQIPEGKMTPIEDIVTGHAAKININGALSHDDYRIPYWVRGDNNFLYTVRIDNELSSRINAFSMAANGFPSYTDGNMGRMIYFSAVTITTLGYGDIAPLSQNARTIVTMEAILGVVLIGLFLNALAHEIGNTKSTG